MAAVRVGTVGVVVFRIPAEPEFLVLPRSACGTRQWLATAIAVLQAGGGARSGPSLTRDR